MWPQPWEQRVVLVVFLWPIAVLLSLTLFCENKRGSTLYKKKRKEFLDEIISLLNLVGIFLVSCYNNHNIFAMEPLGEFVVLVSVISAVVVYLINCAKPCYNCPWLPKWGAGEVYGSIPTVFHSFRCL